MTDSKTIAIDFDDTLTADPVLWKSFIDRADALGHKLILVTARRNTIENREIIREFLREWDLKIGPMIFTELGSKLDAMKKREIRVDIWIDDNPHALVHGH